MARNITDVINQISALLPDPAPPELSDFLVVLKAELNILKRTADYAAPEGQADEAVWQRLSQILYRYLPNPAGYEFAHKISQIVIFRG